MRWPAAVASLAGEKPLHLRGFSGASGAREPAACEKRVGVAIYSVEWLPVSALLCRRTRDGYECRARPRSGETPAPG